MLTIPDRVDLAD